MSPTSPPRRWYRPSTWHLMDLLPDGPPWWFLPVCGVAGLGLAYLLPDPAPRPQRLDVVTYQETQARQEAVLQAIQEELQRIREALEQRR